MQSEAPKWRNPKTHSRSNRRRRKMRAWRIALGVGLAASLLFGLLLWLLAS